MTQFIQNNYGWIAMGLVSLGITAFFIASACISRTGIKWHKCIQWGCNTLVPTPGLCFSCRREAQKRLEQQVSGASKPNRTTHTRVGECGGNSLPNYRRN